MTVPSPTRLTRYFFAVLRWVLITLAVFTLTVQGGRYLVNQMLPKVYTSSVSLQLPPADLATPAASSSLQPAPRPEFESTMMSPDFLLSVVRDLGLEKEWAKRVYKLDEDQVPDVDALTRMEKLVKISFTSGSDIVQITAASDVPQESADIANAMAERYKTLRDLAQDNSTLMPPQESAVRIISRAEPPTEPTRPDKKFDLMVTFIVAGFLSVMTASFVEIVFLFLRAGDRVGN